MLSARPAGCRRLLALTTRRDITIVTASPRVVIGADTHLDTIHLAVITDTGKSLADSEFPTSPAGYADALAWARSFGAIAVAGVEGTSSYGAGLTQVLQAAGVEVAEVSRPDRAARRRQGKSDPLDARTLKGLATADTTVALNTPALAREQFFSSNASESDVTRYLHRFQQESKRALYMDTAFFQLTQAQTCYDAVAGVRGAA